MSSRVVAGRDTGTLVAWVVDARDRTLGLLDELDDAQLDMPPYLPTVNPFRWEIGHVAWFQDHFVLQGGLGLEATERGAAQLYDSAAVGHERRWRQEPKSRARLRAYVSAVCDRVIEGLAAGDPTPELQDRVLLGIFHADMHNEASIYMRQALGLPAPIPAETVPLAMAPMREGDITIPGGKFQLGAENDDWFAFDNERGPHAVDLASFAIARLPVSQGDLAAFVDAGGYQSQALWSREGWSWRQALSAEQPCYWRRDGAGGWLRRNFETWHPIEPELPASHVSWYEADAWCRWAGRRLPSEAEWEIAADVSGTTGTASKRSYPWGEVGPNAELANLDARVMGCAPRGAYPRGDTPEGCRQLWGNVWEWTTSTFEPYPGFEPGVYAEYSEPWFGARKVLRGGCWATRSRMLRNSLRNFFTPDRRDVYAGFRTCAR